MSRSSIELDFHDSNENDPLLGGYDELDEESGRSEGANVEDRGIVARAGAAITILGSVLNAGRDINVSAHMGVEGLLDDSNSQGHPISSEVRRRRREVWKKIDKKVLPLVIFFQFVATLNRPRMISTSQHDRLALAITYAPFIIAKLPCNLLLKTIGPNMLLPTLATLCGIFTIIQVGTNSYNQQLGCWFFLGLFQGGIFSSIVLYLSSFYPRRKLNSRVFTASPLFISAHLSVFIAGPISDTKRVGDTWILLAEGLLIVLFGALAFLILPRSPKHCEFLDSEEKAYVEHALMECGSIQNESSDVLSWRRVGKACKSSQILLLAIVFFLNGAILGTLSRLIPWIVTDLEAGRLAPLFFIAPIITALTVTVTSAYVCDRFSIHGPLCMFSGVISMAGFIMYYATKSETVAYGSVFLTTSGACCAVPILLVWTTTNSAPHIRRATAIAVGLVMSDLGGLFAIIWRSLDYKVEAMIMIVFSVLTTVVAGVNVVYLHTQNKEKTRIRTSLSREEERGDLGDKSAWFVYSL